MHIWPGSPYPLGATFDGGGTNFAIFSEVAERIELCLFDDDGRERGSSCRSATGWSGTATCPGRARAAVRLPGARAVRAAAGLRCNPTKLLLDPYAKAIDGRVEWGQALFSYRFGDPDAFDDTDSAPYAMKSVVINPYFDWCDDRRCGSLTRVGDLRGARRGHDDAPPRDPGRRARHVRRAGHPAMIEHFLQLGVTAVELMPVHQFVHDRRWSRRASPTTGATTPSASSPRTTATPLRHPRRAGAGVQDDGPHAAPGRASR